MSEKEYFNGLSVDSKHERLTLFPYSWLAVILGLALAGAMRWAYAGAPVYRDEFTTIRLLSAPCVNAVAKALIVELGEEPDQYQAATVEYKGAKYEACHKVFKEQGAVCLVVDGLGHGDIPIQQFKREGDA